MIALSYTGSIGMDTDLIKLVMELDWKRKNDLFKRNVSNLLEDDLIDSGLTPMHCNDMIREQWCELTRRN